ncbi:hypothetical protein SAMN06265222_1067 [Neorhodopirellula lusitana]|uniref:Uncharacterized protein n=1 Tax=Neorhodopirellula lusitana TaxID=445327 RepID=A0ABY1Q3H8_9BACT|nr:hypothetical protein SAMN06265222_1067 [Neorhodopirellula lusitana]
MADTIDKCKPLTGVPAVRLIANAMPSEALSNSLLFVSALACPHTDLLFGGKALFALFQWVPLA